MSDTAPAQRMIGPIKLSPGVTPSQVLIFLVVILTAAWSSSFTILMQPLIINDQLHVPGGQQGMLAGMLGTTQQAAVLLFIGLTGAFADRLGRRAVLMFALAGFAICSLLYPLVSVIWALFLVRFLTGTASTGHTAGGATMMMDMPDNGSRGKFLSLMLVTQAGATAVFTALVASRMPSWFKAAGYSSLEATRYSFWVISLLAVGGLVFAMLFMKDDRPQLAAGAPKPKAPTFAEAVANAGEVLAHARKNPRFAVVLLIGFVIRTDYAIMGSFLGLWIVNSAKLQGVSAIDATKTIGLLAAIASVAGFVTPPLFGIIADKVNRQTMLIWALGFSAVAFCATALVDDVFGPMMIAVIIFIGLCEGAQTLSVQSLFAEEAPPHLRGSAMGLFAILGTSSVLIINVIGGYLFDKVGFTAPFVMEGLLNLAFCIAALLVVRRQKAVGAATASAQPAAKV